MLPFESVAGVDLGRNGTFESLHHTIRRLVANSLRPILQKKQNLEGKMPKSIQNLRLKQKSENVRVASVAGHVKLSVFNDLRPTIRAWRGFGTARPKL